MSARKGRGRGRGRGAKKAVQEEELNGVENQSEDIPELEDSPPPVLTDQHLVRKSLRLNPSDTSKESEIDVNSDAERDVSEIMDSYVLETSQVESETNGDVKEEEDTETSKPEETPSVKEEASSEKHNETSSEKHNDEKMTVDEANDFSSMTVIDEVTAGEVEDTEMVSEDELPAETKEPLDTEAVSDEELPESSRPAEETESVSDEELPPVADKKKKKKQPPEETETVSEDELPEEKKEAAESKAAGETDDSKKEGQKRKLPEGEYDPNSPTSETSQDGTPAAKKQALGDGKAPPPKPTGRKALPELEKYWKAVTDDPTDFTGWTYLLQYVDQENEVEAAREAYDTFLEHYPYCYGYWRKYADYEKKKGNVERCEQVFDKGLKAIPLSVDLWLHYLNYCKTAYADKEDHLRAQFERAIAACGLEFRSDRLWESYIKWESEGKRLVNITNLYDKLLATPTQGYTTHFDNFQEHVSSNPPQTILPVDDFLELRREVLQVLKQYDTPTVAAGEDAPPGAEPEEAPPAGDTTATTKMEEETAALREKIVTSRRKVHKGTVTAVAARWNFEEGIKRPYFHVKPLERCQLKNWKEYLDFEMNDGNQDRIITLFERCLIACALYEEFWTRFIKYLESIPNQTEKMREVYERACLIHHKKKPNLHLLWAAFEESQGCYDKAASILASLDKAVPNLLQVAYRRINLERRRGDFTKVCELYEQYLALNKNKAIITNMTIKYARFSWKMQGDVDKAIGILKKAVEKDKDNTRLYLQLIDMGMQKTPIDEDSITGILQQFLTKEGEPEQKLLFAQRKIEFLEDFGSSITSVQKAHEEYQKYLKQVKDKQKKSGEELKETAAPAHSKKKDYSSHTVTPTTQATNAPAANYSQSYPGYPSGQYPGGQYPAGYNYGQYPAQAQDPNYQNTYQNWGTYPQGNYNYSQQPGWGGYYGSY